MMHRFVACLALASLIFVAPRPAAAATSHTFDTVDAVELHTGGQSSEVSVIITGIMVGQTTPTTVSFYFYSSTDLAMHCHRLAVIVMAKPGKFRFGIGSAITVPGGCKLIRIP